MARVESGTTTECKERANGGRDLTPQDSQTKNHALLEDKISTKSVKGADKGLHNRGKVKLSLACPQDIKINQNVQVKELTDTKSGARLFRLSIPRELVKDALLKPKSKTASSKLMSANIGSPISRSSIDEEMRVADHVSDSPAKSSVGSLEEDDGTP